MQHLGQDLTSYTFYLKLLLRAVNQEIVESPTFWQDSALQEAGLKTEVSSHNLVQDARVIVCCQDATLSGDPSGKLHRYLGPVTEDSGVGCTTSSHR